MLIVGPNHTCAPLARHSKPKSFPASCMSSLSQVAARAVPQGIHVAGTPAKNLVPRIPFGPSLNRIFGMLWCGSSTVCQKSEPVFTVSPSKLHVLRNTRVEHWVPDSRSVFSEDVKFSRTSSTSNIVRTEWSIWWVAEVS